MTDEESDFEYHATFSGECTCPEDCSNYDDTNGHSWGSCDGELEDGSDCPCKAGWEE